MKSARLFFLVLILLGAGTAVFGSKLASNPSAPSPDEEGSELLAFTQTADVDMAGAAIVAFGGLLTLMGLIGFLGNRRSPSKDDAPGGAYAVGGLALPGSGVAGPQSTGGEDAPSEAEILKRLVWPSFTGTPGGGPRKSPPVESSRPPIEETPAAAPPRDEDEITHPSRTPPPALPVVPDPATWNQPDGVLFLFDGRDPEPFYGLVRDLGRRHLPGSGLVIARLQAATAARRGLVVVLGDATGVERFDSIYRQFAGLEFAVRNLNPSLAKPQATLQARSYDPAWVVPNPEPYRAEREAIRLGSYLVRDLDTL